jgi:hypothetical protein
MLHWTPIRGRGYQWWRLDVNQVNVGDLIGELSY